MSIAGLGRSDKFSIKGEKEVSMSRAFVMREVDAIGQDLKEIARALEIECGHIVEAADQAVRAGDETLGGLVRPVREWENLLQYEYSRLANLISHINHLG